METAAEYITRSNPRQRTPLPPREYTKWPDWKKILWLLRDANRHGDGWVTIDVFHDERLFSYRSRISDLRADGFDIPDAEDHPDYGWAYRLIESPQGRLAI